MTPSLVLSAHQAHLARRAAWASAGVTDRGIDLRTKSTGPGAVKVDKRPIWRAPIVTEVPIAANHWRKIIAECAREAGLKVEDLTGPRRTFAIAVPRQKAMWRLQSELGWSLPRIGRHLGGRDHTTVLHGVRRHAQRIAEAQAAGAAR